MLLSVITVSYNSAETIKSTIDSILNQTFTSFEYIIIDGNSTDNTVEIIKNFEDEFIQKEIEFTWISEKDSGIYEAFNKGLNLSKGKWISFLGSDDCYLENAIETYHRAILETRKKIDLFYSNVDIFKGKSKIKSINGVWSWPILKKYMNIAHVGAFHNKDYFLTYGNFDESYKIAGDYELLLRAKDQLKSVKINQKTAVMTAGGVSNSQIKRVLKETFRAKTTTANINRFVCFYDYYLAMFKYYSRKIIYAFIR